MRNSLKIAVLILCTICLPFTGNAQQATGKEDRAFWVENLTRIADPVLVNLSNNTLKKNMPYESLGNRHRFSHLEAVGRLVCGIAPWLELGPDNTPEGKLREKYIDLTVKGIKPFESNWLLFASTVEAALLEFTGECDMERMLYGVKKFRDEWYKGDAMYGDGVDFHMDYYNSFVIHPMLTDVLVVMKKHGIEGADFLDTQLKRHARYAEILERFISPEGSFPVVGRSICYRFGAFHALGQAALMHILPEQVKPAQVRCALTSVIRRQLESPANFDKNGWLRVGFTGEQIEISESYINTGSVYLCAFGLVPLGLPETDEFWSAPYTEWTNVKAWNGEKVQADHAIK